METQTQSQTAAPLIYQRMANILADCTHIGKDRENKEQKYRFRGIDDSYNMLHDHFAKHQVFVMPTVVSESRAERPTKSGGVMTYTILKVKFRFTTIDGSSVECETIGEAADTGDKSSNKAMSTAMKYALFMVFLIPTEGDNDTENSSPEFAPQNRQAPAPAPQIDYAEVDQNVAEKLKAISDAKFFNEFIKDLKSKNLYERYYDSGWITNAAANHGLVQSPVGWIAAPEPTPEQIKKAISDFADCKTIDDIKRVKQEHMAENPLIPKDSAYKEAGKNRVNEIQTKQAE